MFSTWLTSANIAIVSITATVFSLFIMRILNRKHTIPLSLKVRYKAAFPAAPSSAAAPPVAASAEIEERMQTEAPAPKETDFIRIAKFVTSVVITLGLAVFSCLLIWSDHVAESDKKFAYGTLGTIAGFWCKNDKGL